jgi:hypothetical protein
VDQVANRVSGTEDKVEELDQILKDHERCYKNMNGMHKKSGIPSKDQIHES